MSNPLPVRRMHRQDGGGPGRSRLSCTRWLGVSVERESHQAVLSAEPVLPLAVTAPLFSKVSWVLWPGPGSKASIPSPHSAFSAAVLPFIQGRGPSQTRVSLPQGLGTCCDPGPD